MEKVIGYDVDALEEQIKKAEKIRKKRERKKKILNTKKWWYENGIAVAKVTVAGLACITPIVIKTMSCVNETRTKRRLDKIERNKQYTIYDRSLGCYLSLSRKLGKKELVLINKRKQNGEKLVDILNDMNMLK